MMIYFGGRMADALMLQGWRATLLCRTSHKVCSRWIDERKLSDEEEHENADWISRRDIQDLMIADTFVLVGKEVGSCPNSTHGRLTELGIAIGLGITNLYLIGPYESVFTHMCRQFPDWETFVSVLEHPVSMRDTYGPHTLTIER